VTQRGPFDFAQGKLWKGRSSTAPLAFVALKAFH
jgi:hypothetical protein